MWHSARRVLTATREEQVENHARQAATMDQLAADLLKNLQDRTYYHNGIYRRLTEVHGEVIAGVLS